MTELAKWKGWTSWDLQTLSEVINSEQKPLCTYWFLFDYNMHILFLSLFLKDKKII